MSFTARDWGFIAATGARFLDQASKLLMLYGFGFREMPPGSSVPVLPFFNLVMVWNPGVSYGLFPAHGPLGTALLALFSVAAVGALGWWLWRADRPPLAVGLGLVIGGAIGTVIGTRLLVAMPTRAVLLFPGAFVVPFPTACAVGYCLPPLRGSKPLPGSTLKWEEALSPWGKRQGEF